MRMRQRRRHATGQIEQKITHAAEPILHCRSEQIKHPHIDDQVQPPAMQEHIGGERQIIGKQACGRNR
jgi:hypothetical protein